ncbi:MAG TPA: carboxypeptidase-like regulatory domain-containing protein, partial [Bradyrhizobium sp.]
MNLKQAFAVILLSAGNVCTGMSFASGAHSATLRGRVVGAEGGAVAQAMVTVKDERDGYAESVFTDDHGEYKLVSGLSGQLSLRVRKPYYRDVVQGIVLFSGQETHSNQTLKRLESDQEISESLPALFHFDRISFQATGPFDRANF